ncbi:MAG: hypothetical protein SNJ69_08630 [Chloroflexaceae bacterium]
MRRSTKGSSASRSALVLAVCGLAAPRRRRDASPVLAGASSEVIGGVGMSRAYS